jgi:hypothetical protein
VTSVSASDAVNMVNEVPAVVLIINFTSALWNFPVALKIYSKGFSTIRNPLVTSVSTSNAVNLVNEVTAVVLIINFTSEP